MCAQEHDLEACSSGTRLRQVFNPALVGSFTGRAEPRNGYSLLEVRLPDGTLKKWRSNTVEIAPLKVTRTDAFAEGRFGGADALRRALILERLRGDLTDVFYSMGASDTEFLPHQFKPVLRFIESVTGRLLIADEVGLGKTIEAMLIWKELQAREHARRLLVVCPSMLREKWRGELLRRFRIDARIAGAADVVDACRNALHDRSKAFAFIASFDGLRPRRAAAKEHFRKSVRDDLEELLLQHNADVDYALFDYVIIDEAHYARNRETATNRLVQSLNEAAAHMALLTATPIQLNEDNLFQLLRLVDPDRFPDAYVFQQLLSANRPIVAAHDSLRKTPFDLKRARQAVSHARTGRMTDDPVLARAAQALASPDMAPDHRIELARSIERASVLSSSMVRSRKRDVFENRVQRQAVILKVTLHPTEQNFYDRVTRAILTRAKAIRGGNGGAVAQLALITRQRQMASCMAAAAGAWQSDGAIREQLFEEVEEQLFEDFGIDEPISAASVDIDIPGPDTLAAVDSKFDLLRQHLRQRRELHPREKFVLFSFFRGTLSYLARRLDDEGIAAFLIQGGMDSKDAILAAFRDHAGPAILLSSEVGSEGIDLQFCRTLINYDLPWNPMRVEQRIGRLDRIGQAADRIHIVNLALNDTVEDRILMRLYERIGIFQKSIGDLESIIGDAVQELVLDLYRDDLDEKEREERAEQTINALAEKAHSFGELEEQAPNLIAYRDYILDEVRQARDLGRCIEPDELLDFCIETLAERYPGSRMERHRDDSRVHRVALSSDARIGLGTYLASANPVRTTRMHVPGTTVEVTFDPRWQGRLRPAPEQVDATHPLTLWLREELCADAGNVYPAAAVELLRTHARVDPGTYVVAVDRWTVRGLRRENRLRFLGLDLKSGSVIDGVAAERLVQQAMRHGTTLPTGALAELDEVLPASIQHIAECLEKEFHHKVDLFEAENKSLCDRQRDALQGNAGRRIGDLRARLERTHGDEAGLDLRRVQPLIRARLAKEEERLEMQLKKLASSGIVESDSAETIGVVVVVRT